AHHQTLAAAIDWSVDLLDAPARHLLARLSTFAGSFDLAAAEAVGASEVVPAPEVPAVLAGLVERSLVVPFRRGQALRYRLLETIRVHADGALGGERPSIQRVHRDWYLAFAERVGDSFLVQ